MKTCGIYLFNKNRILCAKDVKWFLSDPVWSLEYELKTSTANTRGQKTYFTPLVHIILIVPHARIFACFDLKIIVESIPSAT